MKESIFQGEWMRSFREHYPGSHFVKIPDMPRIGAQARFNPIKPYDCYALLEGVFYAFELKWQKPLTGFAFNKVKGHQIAFLKDVQGNGGKAYLVINYRNHQVPLKQQKMFGVGRRVNMVAIMDPFVYEDVEGSVDGGSLPFSRILSDARIRIFNKEGEFWDIPDILFALKVLS